MIDAPLRPASEHTRTGWCPERSSLVDIDSRRMCRRSACRPAPPPLWHACGAAGWASCLLPLLDIGSRTVPGACRRRSGHRRARPSGPLGVSPRGRPTQRAPMLGGARCRRGTPPTAPPRSLRLMFKCRAWPPLRRADPCRSNLLLLLRRRWRFPRLTQLSQRLLIRPARPRPLAPHGRGALRYGRIPLGGGRCLPHLHPALGCVPRSAMGLFCGMRHISSALNRCSECLGPLSRQSCAERRGG
eukprot:scaffold7011_cov112-Isochrysis_galbana.AAC.17